MALLSICFLEGTKLDMLTADRQGNSDQDRRSTAVRRNINILSSAVLSNRRLVEKLNAAEATAKEMRPIETDSTAYGEGSAIEEREASDAFQQETRTATASRETSIVLPSSPATDRSVQLLRALYDMRHDPPASIAINSSLPSSVTQNRANAHRPFGLLTNTSESEPSFKEKENPTKEIRLLLTEWTSTAQHLLKDNLGDAPNGNTAGTPSKEPSPERNR